MVKTSGSSGALRLPEIPGFFFTEVEGGGWWRRMGKGIFPGRIGALWLVSRVWEEDPWL